MAVQLRRSSCAAPAGLLISIIMVVLLNAQMFTQGRKMESTRGKDLPMHKGTIQTLEASNGDVFDCVDIYKQPAFDNPLLKNHKIEMKPPASISSSFQSSSKVSSSGSTVAQQASMISVQCPEGSVPIIRLPKTQRNNSEDPIVEEIHEYAQVSTSTGQYMAAHGAIDVWNPTVNGTDDVSISQLWLVAEADDKVEIIGVGWMVNPAHYGDTKTRFFTYWSRDNSETRCYNIECPGFVKINTDIPMDTEIRPTSTYNGQRWLLVIEIAKDNITNHWWLTVNSVTVGYWPGDLFSALKDGPATTITWGGEISYDKSVLGSHTTTQMGNGHFSNEGLGKSSRIGDLGVLGMSGGGVIVPPDTLIPDAKTPHCYDLNIVAKDAFFYGGPGYSDKCL